MSRECFPEESSVDGVVGVGVGVISVDAAVVAVVVVVVVVVLVFGLSSVKYPTKLSCAFTRKSVALYTILKITKIVRLLNIKI